MVARQYVDFNRFFESI